MIVVFVFIGAAGGADESPPKLVSVQKIWDRAPHNAFTDLVCFQGKWFCAFREGAAHISPDGALRVISSTDGDNWQSAALVQASDGDLRDAKLAITPQNQLMLTAAKAVGEGPKRSHQSLAWFSADGKSWNEPAEIGDHDFWLWRTIWHKELAYSIGYGCRPDNQWVRLYKSDNGKQFDVVKSKLFEEGYPNESSLVFMPDDRCYCLLRRDGEPNTGMLGVAAPPYTEWTWRDLGRRIGGPHMIRLPGGRFVAAVRLMDAKTRTSLCWLDTQNATLTEFLALPSGGDTSYAGLVWNEGLLWVSYYSSHEGKTSIYLAKVRM